ncbi:DegT/DnrJ/EryC1/StrS family aminotransferase [Amycolatopsis thermophila]|uniref:dTDP-4-amino-4,6-dideoxygalactose transaminase n=1 Tax=Amycolatopsis thermophila TaxID=206084 RepID=A0ABU0F309_9PSEU|nr:DegT/DnrJ/EryC1/StrS family aminotransferase [Amycolatopsis thermophila]MDQ0381546.1 dTDP-4-amino-4,6-dideoxygalactose transaminase [Amycolatopsis thermophila]
MNRPSRIPFTDLAAMTGEIAEEVAERWQRIIASSAFIGGRAVADFEAEWSDYCGTTECVGVGNGTDALRLVLTALGIGAGDEVVVPANTFVATAEAVCGAGAVPRFADVSPDTLLVTAESVRAAITPRTAAVIVVHLYGQVVDTAAISTVTGPAGIAVIEDAAQAHGATWGGRRAGSFGVAGAFSFYPGKNLGAFGDSGAVVTSDARLADRVRSLHDHGRVAGSHVRHEVVGTNSRLDALQAAVLSAKLRHLDRWTEARIAIARRYRDAMAGTVFRMAGTRPEARDVYHLAVTRVPDRDEVRRLLDALGVDTGIHYPTACHLHEPYQRFADSPLPVAERSATELLSLPMFPHMSEDQIGQVCEAIRLIHERYAVRGLVHA